MNEFAKKRWYTVFQVAEITGQKPRAVRMACLNGQILGAYRSRLIGSAPWTIPAVGAQDWFDIIRGIKRDTFTSTHRIGGRARA